MRPSEKLKEKLSELIEIIKNNEYFYNLRVFGSVANGTDTQESDIDFLVDVSPECSLIDFIAFQQELEKILQIRVDLVDSSRINPVVKKTINKTISIG